MIDDFRGPYRWLSNFEPSPVEFDGVIYPTVEHAYQAAKNESPLYRKHILERLLATGDQELIEGNTWGDRFWGVCDGEGQNQLGRLLMELRNELRD